MCYLKPIQNGSVKSFQNQKNDKHCLLYKLEIDWK